tara:strand:+ start:335 stop:514 length:180 start_codon:yes stop_codon:yes gene_type:complete
MKNITITLTARQLKRTLKVLQQLEMYYNFHIEGDPTKQEIKFGEEVENLRELLYKKIIN